MPTDHTNYKEFLDKQKENDKEVKGTNKQKVGPDKHSQEGGWRKIPGFNNYEVSEKGQIRSIDREDAAGNKIKGTELSTRQTSTGTEIVDLWDNGERTTRTVADIVTSAWKSSNTKSSNKQSFHVNRDQTDNSIRNLDLKTHAEINDIVHGDDDKKTNESVVSILIGKGLL